MNHLGECLRWKDGYIWCGMSCFKLRDSSSSLGHGDNNGRGWTKPSAVPTGCQT